MSLITTKAVQQELSISRRSIDVLVKKGAFAKHYLELSGKNAKRRPVRFDSVEIEQFKRQMVLGLPIRRKPSLRRGPVRAVKITQSMKKAGVLQFD